MHAEIFLPAAADPEEFGEDFDGALPHAATASARPLVASRLRIWIPRFERKDFPLPKTPLRCDVDAGSFERVTAADYASRSPLWARCCNIDSERARTEMLQVVPITVGYITDRLAGLVPPY
jgi:hypothetical protein